MAAILLVKGENCWEPLTAHKYLFLAHSSLDSLVRLLCWDASTIHHLNLQHGQGFLTRPFNLVVMNVNFVGYQLWEET